MRQGQEPEEAAERARQDGDRPGLEVAGVASEVVLEVGRPQIGRGLAGLAEVPLQELAGVPQPVECACARTSPQVCRRNESYSARSDREASAVASRPSRVTLVEHAEQMV